ncbi:MAG TPA: 16S rRNA (cytosine(1402)-N(4))-methyltransferase RsmH, partial [Anaeromyxobacteraceae bacterium]|nr:16S rRNA (cytosine(1402)-N(4))-methyltransferase RsmH [Anaeromyxobacteraceae bacterium]
MTEFAHETVLGTEVVAMLRPEPGRLLFDGTLGAGGHALLLLEAGARVIGIDRDPRAVAAAKARLARFGEAFRAARADFRDARNVLDAMGIAAVDGALVDLGVSSPQLDQGERGFSFSQTGPLDMRMSGEGETLAELLRRVDERELARILREYGEEPFARPVARAVKRAVDGDERLDTARLAEVVAGAIPRRAWPRRIHPATRTFQALRIAVNDELGALAAWLDALPGLLAPGGRAAAISFHSLEDRMVKQRFRRLVQSCTCPPDLPVCACGARAGFAAV